MRFRISTLLLFVALICVSLGWVNSEWKRRTSNANEFLVGSEFARGQAFIQTYRSLEGTTLTPPQDRFRRIMLQNIVKSTPYLLSLPKPNNSEILRKDYQASLKQMACHALQLLDIKTPSDFEAAIIRDGELDLMKMNEGHPKMVYYEVLDAKTKKLTPEFEAFLTEMIQAAAEKQ